jgi:hypothetical protein
VQVPSSTQCKCLHQPSASASINPVQVPSCACKQVPPSTQCKCLHQPSASAFMCLQASAFISPVPASVFVCRWRMIGCGVIQIFVLLFLSIVKIYPWIVDSEVICGLRVPKSLNLWTESTLQGARCDSSYFARRGQGRGPTWKPPKESYTTSTASISIDCAGVFAGCFL